MTNSLRHQILAAIETRFKAIVVGEPVENPYTIAYSEVTRKQLEGMRKGLKAVLGIYPTGGDRTPLVSSLKQVDLEIVLEIHISRDAGALEDLLETALLEAERIVMEDHTWGGLAMNTEVTKDETDIGGTFSNSGMATLFFTVTFRHSRTDPSQR